MRLSPILLALGAALAVSSAQAAVFSIDDFGATDVQIFDPTGAAGGGVSSGFNPVLGGNQIATTRALYHELTTGGLNNGTTSSVGVGAGFNNPAGQLNIQNAGQANAIVNVTWTLNPASLLAAIGGQSQVALFFDVVNSDTGNPPVNTVIDFELNSVSFKTVSLPNIVNTQLSFDLTVAQIASLTSGGLLSMSITGQPGYDLNLNRVGLTVPEPTSLALGGLALLAAGMASRRRKA